MVEQYTVVAHVVGSSLTHHTLRLNGTPQGTHMFEPMGGGDAPNAPNPPYVPHILDQGNRAYLKRTGQTRHSALGVVGQIRLPWRRWDRPYLRSPMLRRSADRDPQGGGGIGNRWHRKWLPWWQQCSILGTHCTNTPEITSWNPSRPAAEPSLLTVLWVRWR